MPHSRHLVLGRYSIRDDMLLFDGSPIGTLPPWDGVDWAPRTKTALGHMLLDLVQRFQLSQEVTIGELATYLQLSVDEFGLEVAHVVCSGLS